MAATHGSSVARWALAAGIVAAVWACGGGSNSTTSPSPPGACTASTTSTTITIANSAVCPQHITVPRGTQVTFVNQDTVSHEMYSDPHPEHTDCPEINSVGHLEPGQSRQTENLNTARVCGYHDHERPDAASLKGNITIQ
jgi:plastocyanin